MKLTTRLAFLLSTLGGLSACGDSTSTPSDAPDASTDLGTVIPDIGPLTDAGEPVGAGTCASPIDLSRYGVRKGDAVIYRGTTVGQGDLLHPYEGCVERDAAETVFRYSVPANTTALMLSTEGSAFDTALYVRSACSQAMGGADIVCNNDSYDSAPESTVYVTNLVEGQVIFIVVDGNAAKEAVSQGNYVLTVQSVELGAANNPCRAVTEPPTDQCGAGFRCSEGGAADGTALCVPTAANEAPCDPRQFDNICLPGSTCVTEPNAMEGAMPVSLCSQPGARQGAPCRGSDPQCAAPYTCGAGEEPRCVVVVPRGLECDPASEANRCASGFSCGALGDGGTPICH